MFDLFSHRKRVAEGETRDVFVRRYVDGVIFEYCRKRRDRCLSLLLTPSGAETLVFWVSQLLACLVAPKDVPLMTRRGDLKLSHGATAKARETAVKQDRVQTTNAIKSP